jgi:hypothetical protein
LFCFETDLVLILTLPCSLLVHGRISLAALHKATVRVVADTPPSSDKSSLFARRFHGQYRQIFGRGGGHREVEWRY